MLRKRRSQVHLHEEAQAAFRSKDHRQLVRATHASSKRLARPTKLSMRSFWTCAKRMIRSGGWAIRQVAREGVDGSYGGSCRDLASHLTSQGERGPVRSFSLECGSRPRGPPSTLLFDIFIDDLVAGLHDTCSEHGICMGQTDVASLLYADDANAILHPNGLQS
jgi:hypothetical protein